MKIKEKIQGDESQNLANESSGTLRAAGEAPDGQTGLDADAHAIARIREIKNAVRNMEAQVKLLRKEMQELINTRALAHAEIQIGQEVDVPFGYKHQTRRYRVTGITGWFWSPRDVQEDVTGKEAPEVPDGTFQPYYHGRQVKADGSLSETVKPLSNIKKVYPAKPDTSE